MYTYAASKCKVLTSLGKNLETVALFREKYSTDRVWAISDGQKEGLEIWCG